MTRRWEVRKKKHPLGFYVEGWGCSWGRKNVHMLQDLCCCHVTSVKASEHQYSLVLVCGKWTLCEGMYEEQIVVSSYAIISPTGKSSLLHNFVKELCIIMQCGTVVSIMLCYLAWLLIGKHRYGCHGIFLGTYLGLFRYVV